MRAHSGYAGCAPLPVQREGRERDDEERTDEVGRDLEIGPLEARVLEEEEFKRGPREVNGRAKDADPCAHQELPVPADLAAPSLWVTVLRD